MKISRNWLQTYFEAELPSAEALSDALTFHAFEIDGIDPVHAQDKQGGEDVEPIDYVLDVKITPNRGHDCLSHRGIAKELSAILQLPLKSDPSLSRTVLDNIKDGPGYVTLAQKTDSVRVAIQSPVCARYIAGHIKGVRVGPSPQWLKDRLAAVGQRSINNIVDATNYVMFDLGQPLHAFAAEKLLAQSGAYAITVRAAVDGECLLALDDKSYTLSPANMVIADGNTGEAVGIAGVKGGKPAGVTEATSEIIIESANFDGVSVRKTAQALKLRTDASQRFEQQLSPELAAQAMHAVVDLILQLSPGAEVVGFVNEYPVPQEKKTVSVTTAQVAAVLGNTFGEKEIVDSFDRLGFSYTREGDIFSVEIPPERLDLAPPAGGPEDLIEEVGRIQGYDHVPATPLPPFSKTPEINNNFYAAEKAREDFVRQGFSEVFTSVFADTGERVVLNKVDGVRPYLRSNLVDGLTYALNNNLPNKELLSLTTIKLFEIGTIWRDGKEVIMIGSIEGTRRDENKREVVGRVPTEKPLDPLSARVYDDLPLSQTERYQPFSKYPYIVRDIAAWFPAGVDDKKIEEVIKKEAGELCIKLSLFDRFEKPAKDGAPAKTSLAFRLIFQSFDRTLTDEEVNAAMEKVYATLTGEGFEIR